MALIVTLNIFTGPINPRWILSGKPELDLESKLKSQLRTSLVPTGVFGDLGYSGFSIYTIDNGNLPQEFHIQNGIAHFGRYGPNRLLDNLAVEKWLLETGSKYISKSLFAFIDASLTQLKKNKGRSLSRIELTPSLAISKAEWGDGYAPFRWNNSDWIRKSNNCYNYAVGYPTCTYAQPGRSKGVFEIDTPKKLMDAAKQDGIRKVDHGLLKTKPTNAGTQLLALAFSPKTNAYHWFRRDGKEKWSHKIGAGPAKATDHSGVLIKNPEESDRGIYTNFLGYFECDSEVSII